MALTFRRVALLAPLLAAAALWSCDDGGGESADPCEGLDSCVRRGETRCATGAAVQTCERNEGGCLVWQRTASCSERQECGPAAGGFACLCFNACTTLGPVACDGDTILGCVEDDNGCLVFAPMTDCTATEEVCSDASGTPECAVECYDRCETLGATECVGNMVAECFDGPHGCTAFRMITDCSAEGQECDGSSGSGVCVDP